jgi:hypothetical protein
MLVFGEVHTGLLQHSTSVTSALAGRILSLRLGDDVRSYTRPISHVVSPDLYDGLDCRLTTDSGLRPRAVGTATSYASITGGQVVQAVATTTIRSGESDHRLPWSYYLSRPGVLETLGPAPWTRLAAGWLAAEDAAPNLGAISGRLLDVVQRSPQLHRPAPLKAARTKLRWVLEPSEADPRIDFSLEQGRLRTVRLTGRGFGQREVADFCADLALHDWLLTTLLATIERSGLESGAGSVAIGRLRPLIDHVLHHWMPAARLDEISRGLWRSVDQAAGLTRQWDTQVTRVRDQLALHTVTLLGAAAQWQSQEIRGAAAERRHQEQEIRGAAAERRHQEQK